MLKSMNFLKALTTTWWGADPEVLLIVYKSLILSITDYASFLYGNANKSTLKMLNKLQYQSLRICIGCMKSTPVKNILVESSQLPLHLRRQMISNKYFLKIASDQTDMRVLKVRELASLCASHPYWTNKPKP